MPGKTKHKPKAIFIGSNPSLQNDDPETPFKGARSGKTLEQWIVTMGLDPSQCGFLNLSNESTKTQAQLKKSMIDLDQFKFNLIMKLLEMYHGDKALAMAVSVFQDKGKLDPSKLVPNTPDEVKEHVTEVNKTPMSKIISLGTMASWGLDKIDMPHFELPHPSGLNHKLNDKQFVEERLKACSHWIYEG
jgi:Uracil DNA glycosylase superfamily